jgi:hypothetical protein
MLMRQAILSVATCAAAVIVPLSALAGCETKPAGEPKRMEVLLGEAIEDQPWDWPYFRSGRPSSLAMRAESHEVTVRLRDERTYATVSTTVFLEQREGFVNYVSLTPQPRLAEFKHQKLVDFPDAVAEIGRLAREFDIHEDSDLRAKLREWKKLHPKSEPFAPNYLKAVMLADDVQLEFQIKSDIGGDGWYVVLRFYDMRFYRRPGTNDDVEHGTISPFPGIGDHGSRSFLLLSSASLTPTLDTTLPACVRARSQRTYSTR